MLRNIKWLWIFRALFAISIWVVVQQAYGIPFGIIGLLFGVLVCFLALVCFDGIVWSYKNYGSK